MLEFPKQDGLTANPGMCAVGWREVHYLRPHFASIHMHLEVDKSAAIPGGLLG